MFNFNFGRFGSDDSTDFDRDRADEVAARAMEAQLELIN
jgi:hypothetical protein